MKYVKGDLFTAPYGEIIGHSCNAQGKWGAGIAVEFKRRYPSAHISYQTKCFLNKPADILGTTQLVADSGHLIANMIVSNRYGWAKDSEEEILWNTQRALIELANLSRQLRTRVHLPKINSGKFGVPWNRTERLIQQYLEPSTAGVVIYEL